MKQISIVLIVLVLSSLCISVKAQEEFRDAKGNLHWYFTPTRSEYKYLSGSEYEAASMSRFKSSNRYTNSTSDILVNETSGTCGADQYSPKVVTNKNGILLLGWIDYRNGAADLYIQYFTQDALPLSGPIWLNEGRPYVWNSGFHIATGGNGNFIVAWEEDCRSIVAQILDENGNEVSPVFRVNSSSINSVLNCNDPCVAIDDDGNFLITWFQDYYGQLYEGSYYLYGRCFSSDGEPHGITFPIDNPDYYAGGSIGGNRRAIYDGAGHFVVAWSEAQEYNANIYAQFYDFAGNAIDTNIVINTEVPGINNYFPSLTALNDGTILVVYSDRTDTRGSYVFGQLINYSIGLLGDRYKLNEGDDIYKILSSTIVDDDGNFLISHKGHDTVKLRRFNQDWSLIGDPIEVFYNNVGTWTDDINICEYENSNYVMFWSDHKMNVSQIAMQRFWPDGSPSSNFFYIDEEHTGAFQTGPSIAANNNGTFLVVWEDRRFGYTNIFGQLYDEDKNPIGNNFKINSNSEKNCQNPFVKTDDQNNFWVIWYYGNHEAYFQKLTGTGNFVDSNILLNTLPNDFYGLFDINVNENNEILISWLAKNIRTNIYGFFAQEFNQNLAPVGESVLLFNQMPESGNYRYVQSSIVDKDWNFYIPWVTTESNYPANPNQLVLQKFDWNEKQLSDMLFITDNQTDEEPYYPKVNINEFNELNITWVMNNTFSEYSIFFKSIPLNLTSNSEARTIKDGIRSFPYIMKLVSNPGDSQVILWEESDRLYAQRLFPNGNLVGENFEIPFNHIERNCEYTCDYNSGNFYWAWTDHPTPGTGMDIYMNSSPLFDLAIDVDSTRNFLFQNYPNPFNPQTTITFNLNKDEHVTLKVYDVLGREVLTLIDENMQAGLKHVEFNGSNLASGIYIYHLIAGKINIAKKMLLLK